MGVNYAEMLGIDLNKLREESFDHMPHFWMLQEHEKEVERWQNYQELQSRHTEENRSKQLDHDKITTNRKNGH